MSANLQGMNKREAEARIINRAWKDGAFKRRLLDDPRAAIAEETGVDIPPSFQVKVLEETPNTLYLVLPASAAVEDEGELSDLELEAVAGGADKNPPPIKEPSCGGPYTGGTSTQTPATTATTDPQCS